MAQEESMRASETALASIRPQHQVVERLQKLIAMRDKLEERLAAERGKDRLDMLGLEDLRSRIWELGWVLGLRTDWSS